MEYGRSPPGRIESRRNREMVKIQVHTMTTAEKIASGGEWSKWYISLKTADAKVWVERRRARCVRRRMRSVEAAGKESCRRRQSATCRALGALEQKEVVIALCAAMTGNC
jgi:hypothetical protein